MKKIVKTILSTSLLICILMPILPIAALASYQNSCGANITWTLDDNGVLTLSGTGEMTNYDTDESVPWDNKRSDILTVKIQYGITSIGNRAFARCDNLNNVIIPDSIHNLGVKSFEHCNGLKNISIPNGASLQELAFGSCLNLEKL